MFYHASQTGGITVLEPRVSNHHRPLIYFSKKRENVLAYLSNAIQKFCLENGFENSGVWTKWAAYGFDPDGILRVEEYYPNATELTYKGVSGYIYSAEDVRDSGFEIKIPDAVTSDVPVEVLSCEFVPDAYEAILDAREKGLLRILRFEDVTEKGHRWIERTVREEYAGAAPDYRFFLKAKFPEILKDIK